MGKARTGNGSTRNSKKRFSEILETASYLFVEKGYEATSVQDIAEAVGVLKGSLYYYIDAKEDILYWVIRSNHEDLQASLDALQLDVGDRLPTEKLRAFIDNHMDFVLHNLARSASFHYEFRSLNTERQAEIVALRRGYERTLCGLVAEAQRAGSVCPDLDTALSARAILSLLNSAQRWYRADSRFAIDDVRWTYAELAYRSVSCDAHAAGETHEVGSTDGAGALPAAGA